MSDTPPISLAVLRPRCWRQRHRARTLRIQERWRPVDVVQLALVEGVTRACLQRGYPIFGALSGCTYGNTAAHPDTRTPIQTWSHLHRRRDTPAPTCPHPHAPARPRTLPENNQLRVGKSRPTDGTNVALRNLIRGTACIKSFWTVAPRCDETKKAFVRGSNARYTNTCSCNCGVRCQFVVPRFFFCSFLC